MERTSVCGLLLKGLGGRYEILGEDGNIYICRGKGSLRRDVGKLQIGDRVSLRIEDETPDGIMIEAVLPRKNSLIRPPLSNLDAFWLVIAAAHPAPALDTSDKMLAICEYLHITPAVLVTKADEAPEEADRIAALYKKAGFDAFAVSSVTGQGIEAVRCHVSASLAGGRIGAFAGASGVGKSTLINCLFPGLFRETGELSQKTMRGKHTTRSVELLSVPGTEGFLADTPGFSLLDFERFDFFPLDALVDCFREFPAFAAKCRYGDCTHVKEGAEECAVRRAVAEGQISESRYAGYTALYETLKTKEENFYNK